ncbi:Rhodanese-like domain-containing protein [Podospora australis]|uniref:Rhodanese-like domain-containing protein n=1 Tax=Podospora australis TaxID=1536484 RepID=A0AAN6X4L1_9PEZI|nr:Rhodanese-like domain-containing protein [Podospora australis]
MAAPRKAVTLLAQVATRPAAPLRPTAAIATASSRQFHSYKPLSATYYNNNAVPRRAQVIKTPSTQRKVFYSTENNGGQGEPKPSKIYDFEAINKLLTSSSPSPKVTLIDSREPGELQQTGYIPGAINIPVTSSPDGFFISEEEFEDRFGYPRPPKDQEVVFYCKAGVRSRAAASLAKDAGWEKVGEYPGSWLDWFEKGGKVERS